MVALGGMVVPIAVYLAINFGRSSASGWGTAMSTDTAFALGALALVGPGVPDRVRTYLLTFALADDVAGIVVIALAYSGHIDLTALAAGVAILGAVMVARRSPMAASQPSAVALGENPRASAKKQIAALVMSVRTTLSATGPARTEGRQMAIVRKRAMIPSPMSAFTPSAVDSATEAAAITRMPGSWRPRASGSSWTSEPGCPPPRTRMTWRSEPRPSHGSSTWIMTRW